MKRTKQINLAAMRKAATSKTVALTGTLLLAGCSSTQEAVIFSSAEQCIAENPDSRAECEKAYDNAVAEAERTAPKYSSQRACELEFGYNQCNQSQSNSGWFLPAMGGFLLGRALSGGGGGGYNYGRSSPLFGYRNSWVGADGTSYGNRFDRSVRVSKGAFKSKPATTRTISRGGFGSKIQAKSSWGSSRSRGSFGG